MAVVVSPKARIVFYSQVTFLVLPQLCTKPILTCLAIRNLFCCHCFPSQNLPFYRYLFPSWVLDVFCLLYGDILCLDLDWPQSSIFFVKNYRITVNLISQDYSYRNSFIYKQTHSNNILKLSRMPRSAFGLCVSHSG